MCLTDEGEPAGARDQLEHEQWKETIRALILLCLPEERSALPARPSRPCHTLFFHFIGLRGNILLSWTFNVVFCDVCILHSSLRLSLSFAYSPPPPSTPTPLASVHVQNENKTPDKDVQFGRSPHSVRGLAFEWRHLDLLRWHVWLCSSNFIPHMPFGIRNVTPHSKSRETERDGEQAREKEMRDRERQSEKEWHIQTRDLI